MINTWMVEVTIPPMIGTLNYLVESRSARQQDAISDHRQAGRLDTEG
jgi:hypothetical protein